MRGYKTNDKMEILKKIAMEGKRNASRSRIVVITQGHMDTFAGKYDFATKKFESVVVSPTRIDVKDIIDTNGAGDCKKRVDKCGVAFCGGFLVAMALGKDLATGIKYGNYLGWECIQQVGCVFPKTCKMSLE